MDSVGEPSKGSRLNVDRINSLQPLSPPAGYIYVVRDIEISGTYKIGYTGHPATRFANFDHQLPFGIEPVLILRIDGDAAQFEQRLHRRFEKYKVFGEWFRLVERDIGQLREQSKALVVYVASVDFTRTRAQKAPREITYIPPHIYRRLTKIHGSGYVYVIQDEGDTRLFRILWTYDPGKINWFEVNIPSRTKVVLVEPGDKHRSDELNRRYAVYQRVGEWLDLDDGQIQEIQDSLLPPPATLRKPQPSAAPTLRQPLAPAPAPTTVRPPVESVPSPTTSRQSVKGPLFLIAFIVLIGLALVIALANNMFNSLQSQLANPTEMLTAASVLVEPTDDPICDTSQYVFGTSDYILCSSVPNNLKPVRRGHCLYEYLDDRDGDGVACESFIAPVSTIESVAGALTVAPDQTDDHECNLSRYVRGASGYILCSSVPNQLKPVRRGHCLYKHLDDRDGDGAVCESYNP